MFCDMFLGHPTKYWIELQKEVDVKIPDQQRFQELLLENAVLRSKVNYFETRMMEILEISKRIGKNGST